MTSRGPTSTTVDRRVAVAMLVVIVTAAGCGSGESDPTATTPPAPTSTIPITTTVLSPEVELPDPGEPWDLLFLAYEYFWSGVATNPPSDRRPWGHLHSFQPSRS
jgi:hypothetical protein